MKWTAVHTFNTSVLKIIVFILPSSLKTCSPTGIQVVCDSTKNFLSSMLYLAHLVQMPKSLCNHELSVVCHCCPALESSPVDASPKRLDHRNVLSCTFLHMPLVYVHRIFSLCDLHFQIGSHFSFFPVHTSYAYLVSHRTFIFNTYVHISNPRHSQKPAVIIL